LALFCPRKITWVRVRVRAKAEVRVRFRAKAKVRIRVRKKPRAHLPAIATEVTAKGQ